MKAIKWASVLFHNESTIDTKKNSEKSIVWFGEAFEGDMIKG